MKVVLSGKSKFFSAAALIFFATVLPAKSQSCLDGMASNMQQMAQNALQCGESANSIGSLTETGVISGEIPAEVLEQMCQNRVDVDNQLSAFNECSRVYVCATAAYAYAIQNIDSFGGDCTAAANAGLSKYPVQ